MLNNVKRSLCSYRGSAIPQYQPASSLDKTQLQAFGGT